MAQGDVVGLAVTFTHAQIPGTSPVVTLAYQQQTANDGGNTDLAEALAIGGRVIDVLVSRPENTSPFPLGAGWRTDAWKKEYVPPRLSPRKVGRDEDWASRSTSNLWDGTLAADMTTDVFDDETTIGPCVVYGVTKPTIGGQVPGKAGPGSSISDLLSPRTAVVITKTSGLRGRSYRGRSYLPFVPEAAQNRGTMTNTYVTAYQTIADNLDSFAAVGGTGAAQQQVIYSPTLSEEQGQVVATPVLQMIVPASAGLNPGKVEGQLVTRATRFSLSPASGASRALSLHFRSDILRRNAQIPAQARLGR